MGGGDWRNDKPGFRGRKIGANLKLNMDLNPGIRINCDNYLFSYRHFLVNNKHSTYVVVN